MKYLFFFLIAASVFACTSTDKPSPSGNETRDSLNKISMKDSSNYTAIEWLDSTHIDLGKVTEGQVVEVSWPFKNTGNKTLIIESVHPGCGCTVPDNKPLEPIAPGEKGVIKANFNSAGQHIGQNTKTVTVTANTKENTVHYLTFSVEVTK
jgi:hypothetical protein